jgi:hypothetical protein
LPAFIEAHHELQDLPRKPSCTLLWAVITLMIASDATHLTNFSTAKLWPSYLYFGNELKYHWCKPSCHLCNHVAYFQAVSITAQPTFQSLALTLFYSSQMPSKTLLQNKLGGRVQVKPLWPTAGTNCFMHSGTC